MTRRDSNDELRKRAEAFLRTSPRQVRAMPPEDLQALVFELQVYQVELEMQNEELRRVQQELLVARDRYVDLYEFSPMGYATLDGSGVITSANLTLAAMTRMDRGQLVNTSFDLLVAGRHRRAFQDHLAKVFASREKHHLEIDLMRPDGDPLSLYLETIAQPSRTGVPTECRVAATDITELRKAHTTLEENERRLRLLTDALPVMISYVDRERRCRFVNRNVEGWLDLSRDEMQGKHIQEFLPAEVYRLAMPRIETVLRGEVVRFEIDLPQQDGSTRLHAVVYVPNQDAHGVVHGFYVLATDVTDQKIVEQGLREINNGLESQLSISTHELDEAKQDLKSRIQTTKELAAKLRESNDRFKALANTAPDAILVVHRSGEIASANPAAARLFGCGTDNIEGRPLKDFVPAFATVENAELQVRELTARKLDGSIIPVEVSTSRFHDEIEWRMTLIVRDISERKELERAMADLVVEEQRKILQYFHDELGQELTAFGLQAGSLRHALEQQGSADAKRAEVLESELAKARKRLSRMIAGLRPVDVGAADIVGALHGYAATTQRLAGIACEFESGNVPAGLSDKTANQLFHIAQEAVSNAQRHSGADRITVSLDSDDRNLVLEVRDNGCGISEDTESTGMGRRIMRYRSNDIGGTLTIESAPEGGTVVRCSVPVLDAEAPGSGQGRSAPRE